MSHSTWIAVAVGGVVMVGCAAKQTMPPRHLSTQEHIEEARRHDQLAADQETHVRRHRERKIDGPMECIDTPMAPEPTSGGVALNVMKPCWTRQTDRGLLAHKRELARHQRQAELHRARARELVQAERLACSGIGQDERSHTPFWHREDIASVEPIVGKGVITGAVVLFKRVPGLSVEWMRKAVACHRARAAAVGFKPTFMGYCPMMLADTVASVSGGPAGVEVRLESSRSEIGTAIWERARDLTVRAPVTPGR